VPIVIFPDLITISTTFVKGKLSILNMPKGRRVLMDTHVSHHEEDISFLHNIFSLTEHIKIPDLEV